MDGWLTIAKAAEYCNISKRTITNWINKKGLKVSRVNQKLILIKKTDLDEFLEGFYESNNCKDQINEIIDEVIGEMV